MCFPSESQKNNLAYMILYVICAVYLYIMAWGCVEMADRTTCFQGSQARQIQKGSSCSFWASYQIFLTALLLKYRAARLHLQLLTKKMGFEIHKLQCSQTCISACLFLWRFSKLLLQRIIFPKPFQSWWQLQDCQDCGNPVYLPRRHHQLQLFHHRTHMLVVHNSKCHTHTLDSVSDVVFQFLLWTLFILSISGFSSFLFLL